VARRPANRTDSKNWFGATSWLSPRLGLWRLRWSLACSFDVEYLKERTALQRAVAAEKRTSAINQFLTEGLLFQATPEQNGWQEKVTMGEALNRATSKYLDHNSEMAQQPELEATLRLAVGRTYLKQGLLSEAERNLRKAVTLRQSVLGENTWRPSTPSIGWPRCSVTREKMKKPNGSVVKSGRAGCGCLAPSTPTRSLNGTL